MSAPIAASSADTRSGRRVAAWVVSELGAPEAMHLSDVPAPSAGPGQTVVQVAAVGLNFLDTLMIAGGYQVKPPLPFIPGVEFSGRIAAAGEGSRFAVGQPVCGQVDFGAMAEEVVANDHELLALPEDVDLVSAAALPIVYPTAHAALVLRAGLSAGETVLVHSAAGGVGLAAVQVAKALGARVIGTARGAHKAAIVRAEGADACLDYSDASWVEAVKALTDGRGADIVIDPVGGEITRASLRCLAWSGRLVVVGFAAGSIPAIPTNLLLLKNISLVGVHWGAYRTHDRTQFIQTFDEVLDLWRRGLIAPVISRRHPMTEAPQALRDLAERRTHGKVVLAI